MLNGVAGGTLIVVNTFYQQKLDFNSQETGYISYIPNCSINYDTCG